MNDENVLKWVDPGTGCTVEELIDAIILNSREANSLKRYLVEKQAERKRGTMAVTWT